MKTKRITQAYFKQSINLVSQQEYDRGFKTGQNKAFCEIKEDTVKQKQETQTKFMIAAGQAIQAIASAIDSFPR